jgi:hypothetical protein
MFILQWLYLWTFSWSQKNYCEYFLLTEDDTCGGFWLCVEVCFIQLYAYGLAFDMFNMFWLELCIWCCLHDHIMSYEWVNKKTGGLGTKASVNWGDQRMNWGLRTKASSNWLDQRVNRKFRYQCINTLIRPTDKPKVQGLITKLVSIGPLRDLMKHRLPLISTEHRLIMKEA